MRKYFDNKKYYVKRAIKVAKEVNNQKAVDLLKIYLRKGNVYPTAFIKETAIKINNVDLFNIEANKD